MAVGYITTAYYPYYNVEDTINKQVFGGDTTILHTLANADLVNKFTLAWDTVNREKYLIFVGQGNSTNPSDEGKMMTINMSTDVVTQIPAAPQPCNPFVAFLDGYVFAAIAETDEIYNSDLNDITSWNLGVNFIKSSTKTGKITGLTSYKNYILAFKEFSCEFFYNAGNTGTSPLQRNENLSISVGCSFPNTIAFGEDVLFWVGRGEYGNSNGVYMLAGDSLKKVSTPAIDRALFDDQEETALLGDNYRNPKYGTACITKLNGHTYYILAIAPRHNLVYCLDNNQWAVWKHRDLEGCIRHVANYNGQLVGNSKGPMFYFVNEDEGYFGSFTVFQNYFDTLNGATVPIVMKVTTPPIDLGTTKRKIVSNMRWSGTIEPNRNVRVSWSDDNQHTTSDWHTFSIGYNPTIRNLGQFRRREFTFELTNIQNINTPETESTLLLPRVRMEGIELEYREGTS